MGCAAGQVVGQTRRLPRDGGTLYELKVQERADSPAHHLLPAQCPRFPGTP